MLTIFIGFMDALFMIILVFFGCIFSLQPKLYQYRWNKSKSKVIITCKDDDTKEASCFKLDN